jgi:anti-sigma factor ChrR (cupin superfamily)
MEVCDRLMGGTDMSGDVSFADIQRTLARTDDMKWIEMSPGETWAKVLYGNRETGAWAGLYRWRKGYIAAPHRHLGAAHSLIFKGRLEFRGGILGPGDYAYEANGAVHGATTTLEDCEFFFFSQGPILITQDEAGTVPVGYFNWEHIAPLAEPGHGANG